MQRPRFSVITPSFNQGPFIERTVRSVLDQVGDFDLEYLVFDGGSTDSTLDVLRRHEGRLQWTSGPDDGQVDAINNGLRACKGDIIGWVNSDDTLAPGALAGVVDAFRRDPGGLWVHGRSELIDEHDQPIRRLVSEYKHRNCVRYSYDRLLTENFIHQPSVFWRREAMSRAGWLDPTSELAFDYDWFLRLAKLGAPLYVPERYARLRWYEQSKSGAHFMRQLQEAYDIARRHDPDRPWHDMVKRFRIGRIMAAYGLMYAGRRAAHWSADRLRAAVGRGP
jgi:glycosyltransferase involved in cell wall biosynthesis